MKMVYDINVRKSITLFDRETYIIILRVNLGKSKEGQRRRKMYGERKEVRKRERNEKKLGERKDTDEQMLKCSRPDPLPKI